MNPAHLAASNLRIFSLDEFPAMLAIHPMENVIEIYAHFTGD
jgi:hypothetical protein